MVNGRLHGFWCWAVAAASQLQCWARVSRAATPRRHGAGVLPLRTRRGCSALFPCARRVVHCTKGLAKHSERASAFSLACRCRRWRTLQPAKTLSSHITMTGDVLCQLVSLHVRTYITETLIFASDCAVGRRAGPGQAARVRARGRSQAGPGRAGEPGRGPRRTPPRPQPQPRAPAPLALPRAQAPRPRPQKRRPAQRRARRCAQGRARGREGRQGKV